MIFIIKKNQIDSFKDHLIDRERSKSTREKYSRDLVLFFTFCYDKQKVSFFDCADDVEVEISKETIVAYKEYLTINYKLTSVNSMLAALNRFFEFVGYYELRIRYYKFQGQLYRPEDKQLTLEEYKRLMQVAKNKKRDWLYYVMMTMCATGIRVGEVPFITVEALNRGYAIVTLKGKTRIVIIPATLREKLKDYAKDKKIKSGSIFVTKKGKVIDRSNILHSMKALCDEAEVDKSKVYPHNLRHLFAVTYYKQEKDISHLADILGHSSIDTTRIYTMETVSEQEKKIDNLGLIL